MSVDPNSATPGQTPTSAPSTDYGAAGSQAYAGAPPTKDEQNLAVLCYILGIFTWLIGPLIIWLVKKDSSKFVDDQGKEVINWGITITIAWVALIVVGMILSHIPFLGFLVMLLLRLALFVCALIFNIIGAMQVSKGIAYRYPFALRLIK